MALSWGMGRWQRMPGLQLGAEAESFRAAPLPRDQLDRKERETVPGTLLSVADSLILEDLSRRQLS